MGRCSAGEKEDEEGVDQSDQVEVFSSSMTRILIRKVRTASGKLSMQVTISFATANVFIDHIHVLSTRMCSTCTKQTTVTINEYCVMDHWPSLKLCSLRWPA